MTDERAPSSKPRILLVEDDEDTRDLTVAWLTREGYAVDGHPDAEAGLAELRAARYAALVTDNNLPGMLGIELVRIALAERLLEPSQIAIVSSLPPKAEAASLGVSTLKKPVDVHTMLGQIEHLLGAASASELPPRSTERQAVHLLLYVSAGSAASARARRAAWQLARRPGLEHVHLEVRDVAEHTSSAIAHRIAFTPTLLRLSPEPTLRIIGDLREESVLVDAVAVWPSS